jgi:hypothetical protein
VSLALQIDPETSDIVIGAHDAVFVTDPSPELLLAIGVRRGSLWQDPDQGSDIPALVSVGNPPADARSAIEGAAKTALERLEAAGLVVVEAVEFDTFEHELTIDTLELATPIVIEV